MKRLAAVVFVSLLCLVAGLATIQGQSTDRLNADAFKVMTVRNIGPALVTGRVVDIELDPKNPSIWYVASAFGGLWKTENRGQTYTEIFPRSGEVESFNNCCVVVDPKDSNVVWLGTGEDASQRSAHFGTGLYKSTDAGQTWKLSGLPNSEHIGNIVIDPRNSNHVYVAVQGPLFSEGGDRGVYKTLDGGATWQQVLKVNDDTGFNEVALDAKNPDIVIAGTYQRRRHVGQMIGGGPDGGIWRSTNAGKSWTKMTKGLPGSGVDVGRISFAVDPKKPGRMYALIDGKCSVSECNQGGGRGGRGGGAGADAAASTEKPAPVNPMNAPSENDARGFYVSNDSGASWERVSRYRGGGPAYYSEIHVDPRTPDTIWSVNTNFEWSKDGGKTWTEVGIENSTGRGAMAVHVDHHEVVFDPSDPNHIIIGNDGGVYDTYDNGKNWRFHSNLPITQFYRVSAGNEEPFYSVCGGTQDNFSICGPSRTSHTLGTRTSDWYIVNGGDGFFARHDLTDPNVVYASSQDGGVVRFDRRTGRAQPIRPNINTAALGEGVTAIGGAPAGGGAAAAGGGRGGGRGGAERTNWDAPYIVSPHAEGRLYWANNFVYRSDDRGATWTRVSGDLSRNLDYNTLPIMGKVWPQGSVAFHESTTALSNVVSIDESPLLEGLLIVGTDDGLVQITENGGREWRKVEDFPNVPKWAYVSDVAASPRDSNVFFVAFNNWQRGDYKPYIVRSDDRGKTWKNITGDLPAKHDVWAVAQDHVNPNLLFAGTEFGLFFTVDGGSKWVQLKGGMPAAQVRDLQLQRRDSDVVMATFGRGFWILDDYSALREVSAATLNDEARLFPMRNAYQFTPWGMGPDGSAGLSSLGGNYTFPNPPAGVVMTYNVKETYGADTQLVARIFNETNTQVRQIELNKNAGLNRTTWDLRTAVASAGFPEPEEPRTAEDDEKDAKAREREMQQEQQTPPQGAQGRGAGAGGAAPQAGRQGGAPFGGRGGGPQGNLANPGRYRVIIGKLSGETFTQIGPAQTVVVKTLPEQNYVLWR
ncbi:MAG TPA: hypothetical protein VFV98_18915 [Vicinamibacterales bacterium]|nr:hypothetical protein [Vicinamibacterales bacterium]